MECGGFLLPNWPRYQAASLVWIKDWVILKDMRTLALEGHDIPLGWHFYLWSDDKISKTFKNHSIRSLLKT